MKVKGDPGNRADLPRHIGSYYARQTRHGVVIQTWPRRRTSLMSPYKLDLAAEFAIAAMWSVTTENRAQRTCIHWSEGTDLTWRDISVSCMFGNFLEITDETGQVWQRERDVFPSVQGILEQLGSVPGSVPYRDLLLWENLEPGINGQILTMVAGLPSWAPNTGGGGGGAFVNLQLFTAPGTHTGANGWQKPASCQFVEVIPIGPGGGGGSGRRGNAAVNAAGGGAGGGGGRTWARFLATTLADQENVTVGTPGAGGAARTTDATNGAPGANGTPSSFSTGPTEIKANGGTGGAGGTTAAALGGGGGVGRANGTTGGSGSAAGNGGAGTAHSATEPTPTGGGGGAGCAIAPAARNGGDGGASTTNPPFPTAATGAAIGLGGVGGTPTPPTAGGGPILDLLCGYGGGGGYVTAAGLASAGASGGLYGGGGGGGGGSATGSNSGAGGTGGPAAVLIISY